MTCQAEIIPPGTTPKELKADPFLNGLFFQYVDDWILAEAERREYTWQFLLGVPNLPLGCYDFFKSALSVSVAANKLLHMSYGGATINRTLSDEMMKPRRKSDKRAAENSTKQFFRASFTCGFWQGDLETYNFKNDKERTEFERLREQEERRLCKQHGKNWRAKFPDFTNESSVPSTDEIQGQSLQAHFMVNAWLRWGYDQPGLCFFNDESLADVLSLLLREASRYGLGARTEYYRKLRQRLGLEQLYYRKPTVTEARPVPGTGLIEITVRTKNGSMKRLLSETNACALGGRQFYPIPS